jgi:hypothetical protein
VDAAKIAINERVSALGLITRFLVKAEVPFGIVVPGVAFQERILIRGLGLNFAPFTVEHILARGDQSASMSDCALIDQIRGHEISMSYRQKSSDPNEPVRLAPFESTGAGTIIAPTVRLST